MTVSECLKLLQKLAWELATEVDLHYEDDDFFAMTETFSALQQSVRLMEQEGMAIHPDLKHIIDRYIRTRN